MPDMSLSTKGLPIEEWNKNCHSLVQLTPVLLGSSEIFHWSKILLLASYENKEKPLMGCIKIERESTVLH